MKPGVNDNWPMRMAYRRHVLALAKRHRSRRSQKSYVTWRQFYQFVNSDPLPPSFADLDTLSCRVP